MNYSWKREQPNSSTICTQSRARTREPKGKKLPIKPLFSPYVRTNLQHNTQHKKSFIRPQTTTTHKEHPNTTLHQYPKPLPTWRTTVLTRTLANMPREKSPVQSMQKSRTLQQSVPLGKTNVSNPKNKTPTKYAPTKHSTSTTSTKHQTLTGSTTKPNPNSGYPTGHHGGNSRSGKIILYSGSIRQLEHSQPDKPELFHSAQPHKLSPRITDEIWIKTSSDTTEIDWLADTGRPRSFVCKTKAEKILRHCKSAKWKHPTGCQTQYRCFNNIKIPITGKIQMNLRSGHREATNNEILVVDANTVNLLGGDILGKLGFTLSQNRRTHINNINLDNTLQIKIINKFPHLCSRLGKSKNHIAKSTLKQDISPYQHKGRRVPLHLMDKVDKEIQHLLDTNQIVKLDKCSDQVFISPVVITVKYDQSINQTSTRFKSAKRRN